MQWSFVAFCILPQQRRKKKRNIGIFNVVKFQNDPCGGNNAKNGTCYTTEECEDKGGTASGSCAEGYGVCCIFTLGCGATKAENMTYFESSGGSPTGACNAKICKCKENICQLRLDFMTFVIAGPNTVTTSVAKALAGTTVPDGKTTHDNGRCLTDTFSVTAPGSSGVPHICGTNTGYHMYVDASEECNTLSFQLGPSQASREWAIRVTQYACDYENLAPKGCLQYFFATSGTGNLETFNRANKIHLAGQDQNMCIRRESGNCRICYSTAAMDFKISKTATALLGKNSNCCGYMNDGMGVDYDCVIIPDATKKMTALKEIANANGHFCGQNLGTTTGAADKTVCSMSVPFQIRFVSDAFELEGEPGTMGYEGFKIFYEQFKC